MKYSAIAIFIVVLFVFVIYFLHEHLSKSLEASTTVIKAIKSCAESSGTVPQRDSCIAEICNPLQEDQRVDCYMRAQSEIKNHGN